MQRALAIVILLVAVNATAKPVRDHPDYVPDKDTAVKIADAVLVAQYGEERVKLQRPLHADGSRKDLWLVQGAPPNGIHEMGGNFGVWIDKHSGCLKVMEQMK